MAELWEELNVKLLEEIIQWAEKYSNKLPGLYEFYKLESDRATKPFIDLRESGMAKKYVRPKKTNCEICGKEIEGDAIQWDHDDDTGIFRGWLCQSCNTALGFVESLLRRGLIPNVVEYLKRPYRLVEKKR